MVFYARVPLIRRHFKEKVPKTGTFYAIMINVAMKSR